jgi:formamidopyrimidine-DNA glycosylase
MPELPEVELVVRYLRPQLLGRRIQRVTTTKPSYFFLTPPKTLNDELPGERIAGLERLGKYLLVVFKSDRRLLLHLGMTGQLIVAGARNPRLVFSKQRRRGATEPLTDFEPDQHTHLSLHFADNRPALYFRDTRKFGKVRLLEAGQTDPRLAKLGPDALTVKASRLVLTSQSRRVPVKSWLLDQTVITGVGNIYADEALFLTGIHPQRPAQSLTLRDCQALAKTIRRLLRNAIRAGGSSIDDYVHPDGSDGRFQKQFNVYGRAGLPCDQCKTPIVRIVLGGRSTHFCPKCQLK